MLGKDLKPMSKERKDEILSSKMYFDCAGSEESLKLIIDRALPSKIQELLN